jgi:two-component system sensor histidine kinase UhpB
VSLPDEIRQQVALALDEIRAVARRLRPPELDELGVKPALEAHARTLTEGRDLEVSITGHIPESCLSRDTALALFRIAQEAMTNAALHSGARTIKVIFTSRESGLLAEVSDDGRGFDVRDLFTGTAPNLGVTGMRERAVYVGGTFSIDSVPGGGTRVRTLVPWAEGEAEGEEDEEAGTPREAEAVVHPLGAA